MHAVDELSVWQLQRAEMLLFFHKRKKCGYFFFLTLLVQKTLQGNAVLIWHIFVDEIKSVYVCVLCVGFCLLFVATCLGGKKHILKAQNHSA